MSLRNYSIALIDYTPSFSSTEFDPPYLIELARFKNSDSLFLEKIIHQIRAMSSECQLSSLVLAKSRTSPSSSNNDNYVQNIELEKNIYLEKIISHLESNLKSSETSIQLFSNPKISLKVNTFSSSPNVRNKEVQLEFSEGNSVVLPKLVDGYQSDCWRVDTFSLIQLDATPFPATLGFSPLGSDWFFRSAAFINNEWHVSDRSHPSFPVYDPSCDLVFHRLPTCSSTQVDLAVQSASNAFPSWRSLKARDRALYLQRLADAIECRSSYFARLETLDNGKPLRESQSDISDVIGCLRYYADLGSKLDPELDQFSNESNEFDSTSIGSKIGTKIHISDPSFASHLVKEPVGICALISSFNYPLMIAIWKIAPCLAAGCTAILKPSEYTSLSCLELAGLLVECQFPPGVLNILIGHGSITGSSLVDHPLISKVSFTGSVETGNKIAIQAAKQLKKVTLELGGKSPLILTEDADLDQAMDWIKLGVFANAGQVCSSTSRVLVHQSLEKKLKDRLLEQVEKIRIGCGFDPINQLGPLVSRQQFQKVIRFIDGAIFEGARMITGGLFNNQCEEDGSGSRNGENGNGYFLRPTIFDQVNPEMRIWKEEIFGPVLSIMSFKDDQEAINLANSTHYGLAGAVFSKCPKRSQKYAQQLECGIVWINCSQPAFIQAPWGGYKRSGIGRELGPWGLDNYLQIKQVTEWVAKDSKGWGWYD